MDYIFKKPIFLPILLVLFFIISIFAFKFENEKLLKKMNNIELSVQNLTLLISSTDLAAPSGGMETGNYFYIDPINGSANNDGSRSYPWQNLMSVINSGLIEYIEYDSLVYQDFIKVNEGAPVKPGDTLILMPGNHGQVRLKDIQNIVPIKIVSLSNNDTYFTLLEVEDWSSWELENIVIGRKSH